MIPSADRLLAGLSFALRRYRLGGPVSEAAVRAAVAEAIELSSGDERAEPAAIFFAFARRPRVVPAGWRTVPRVLAGVHASTLGLRLDASADEIEALVTRILLREVGFPEVRAWFEARLVVGR